MKKVKHNNLQSNISNSLERLVCIENCESCVQPQSNSVCITNEEILEEGESISGLYDFGYHMIFVIHGGLKVEGKYGPAELTANQCCFFVKDDATSMVATAKTRLIRVDFSHRIIVCGQDYFANLSKIDALNDSVRKPPVADTPPVVEHMLEFVLESKKLQQCNSFQLLCLEQLIMLIDAYCSAAVKIDLFRSAIRSTDDFRAFVLARYLYVNTVEEFAEMAGMSLTSFKAKFRLTFGDTVASWRSKHMTGEVLAAIRDGVESIPELRYRFGFGTSWRFVRFCRVHFDLKPSELIAKIRRERSI